MQNERDQTSESSAQLLLNPHSSRQLGRCLGDTDFRSQYDPLRIIADPRPRRRYIGRPSHCGRTTTPLQTGWRQVSGKSYKCVKKGTGRFVQLPEWVQASEAWATMPPGPRALYIELKRRFTGANNGEIHLSHREAAKALNCSRNTVGPWLRELEKRGFIALTVAPHLGPAGIGKASKWRLEELATPDGKPATKSFMRWTEKQNPRTKNRTPRHKKQDTRPENTAQQAGTVINFVTPSAKTSKAASR